MIHYICDNCGNDYEVQTKDGYLVVPLSWKIKGIANSTTYILACSSKCAKELDRKMNNDQHTKNTEIPKR